MRLFLLVCALLLLKEDTVFATRNNKLAANIRNKTLKTKKEINKIPLANQTSNDYIAIATAEDQEKFVNRQKMIEKLILDAEELLKTQSLADSCLEFRTLIKWLPAEHNIFILNNNGVYYLTNNINTKTWSSIDQDGLTRLRKINKEGEWIIHSWEGGIEYSFIKPINIQGITFYLGSSLYPEMLSLRSKEIIAELLRCNNQMNITQLSELIASGNESYLRNQGNMEISLYDEEGNILVSLDEKQKELNNILKDLQNAEQSIFQTIFMQMKTRDQFQTQKTTKNIQKNYIAQKIYSYSETIDNIRQIKPFILVVSYYQGIKFDDIISFIKQASVFLQTNGKEQAIDKFNDITSEFYLEPLKIVMFDLNGNIIVDPQRKNNTQYEYIPAVLLNSNQQLEGWVSYLTPRGNAEVFYQKVRVAQEEFILCTEVYPFERKYIAQAIANRVESMCATLPIEIMCNQITQNKIGGTDKMKIHLFTSNGTCIASNNIIDVWTKYEDKNEWKSIEQLARNGGGMHSITTERGIKNSYIRFIDQKHNINDNHPLIEPMIEKTETKKTKKLQAKKSSPPVIVPSEKMKKTSAGLVLVVSYYV